MADNPIKDCQAEFKQVIPEKPWNTETAVTKFEPLVNLIDQRTQSDMFRHIGKYAANGDYYDMAKDLEEQNQANGEKTFANGVKAQVEQEDGWPTKLVLEDKAAHLKETVTMNDTTHTIETDKVEYCGVSRERHFGQHGEFFRSYGFPGAHVEREGGAAPVLNLDK